MKFIKRFTLFLFIILSNFTIFGQGKVVLIGGGMERSSSDGWNYELFSWIVSNAENGRVAVLGYEAGDGWLEENFVDTWGASFSDEIIITETNADLQTTYDDLITYDAVYIKGGDQYEYYTNYKDTKTQEALEYIYNNGGVIAGTSAGMHILTDVIFTDDTGYGVYPYEGIENPQINYITLHNDFLGFVPGIFGDSHFAERGRFGRLLGMISNWFFNQSEVVVGIGVDDLTAIAIDENNIGTVYGTGCANFYIPTETTFSQNPENTGKLLADKLQVIQLLQGTSINMNTYEIITNHQTATNLELEQENGDYILLLSGGNELANNTLFVENFVNSLQSNSDNILIVTGSNTSLAEQFETEINNQGANNTNVFSAISSNGNDTEFEIAIQNADAILFVNNELVTFNSFLATSNGNKLKNKAHNTGMLNGFVGENSRYAGKIIIEGYDVAGASYYGEMEFSEGLGLLRTSTVLAETYSNSDLYENTVTAVPYAMTNNGLGFGIWLYDKSCLKFYNENDKTYFTSYGDAPAMILQNTSTYWDNSSQTSSGGGTPRQITGFDQMELSLIDESIAFKVGDYLVPSSNYEIETSENYLAAYPNPASDFLKIELPEGNYTLELYDALGNIYFKKSNIQIAETINTKNLSKGIYFIKSTNTKTKQISIHKIIIQ